MAGEIITGTVFAQAEGIGTLALGENVTVTIKGGTYEPVVTSSGEVFFKETFVAPMIECEFLLTHNFPLQRLMLAHKISVTVEYASGYTFTLANATVIENPTVKSSDSKLMVKFAGASLTYNPGLPRRPEGLPAGTTAAPGGQPLPT